ncbi:hypothetical protein GCM10011490_05960 [Pseudoclavibacter endophyticus]|uniref:Tetratricopeptide repeat protein n=1 Tax=Pseudoclavibacter endophyticus TaxID=1778590 RepID=A0A6H9WP75_9MICO|nr:hypothetical protein [Pseudoclavibacter endophyticus]KAB1649908.1 hypothetical protein F8O04_06700 [Pseudoclavibacter endophyticus]GGA58805.1 hypothetical protein GCM10011490_05960 [Pseudoclavibacter endophyticus]
MSTATDESEADEVITPPEPAGNPAAWRDPVAERRAYLRRLRRRRKRLMLLGIPVAILALLVAAKFLSMTVIANRTVSAYEVADYESALNSAQQQKFLNVVEQWKAPYNTGTVYLQLGLNQEARTELEAALPLASGADECPIRSNLAIAIERIGDQHDADGDGDAAREAWQQALAVLSQAPAECPDSTSSVPMSETQQRLEAKLDPPQSSDDAEEPQDPSEDPSDTGDADQDAIEDIGEQLDENQDDRQDAIDEENDQGGGGGGGTDKPW